MTVTGETSDNLFQYTGRENDGTGLYYYRARYYSPDLQRFISEDPIGLTGGIRFFTNPDIIGHPSSFETNLYLYTGNNPIKYTDPRGLDRYAPCEGHGCIVKWLCKKVIIDKFVCGGAKEVACCEAEKADCMNKVDPNDPQYGEKLHACETLYQCEGKAR